MSKQSSSFPPDEPNPFTTFSIDSINPYQPTADIAAASSVGDADEIERYRKEHLSHEASVKSMGCLFILGGVAMTIPAGLLYLALGVTTLGIANADVASQAFLIGLGIVVISLGIAQSYIGYGIRQFRPWARVGGIVLSTIGLLAIPLGTVFSIFFLFLMISNKGAVVFSDHYRNVINQTPHIRYKTTTRTKIVACLVVMFIVGLVLAIGLLV